MAAVAGVAAAAARAVSARCDGGGCSTRLGWINGVRGFGRSSAGSLQGAARGGRVWPADGSRRHGTRIAKRATAAAAPSAEHGGRATMPAGSVALARLRPMRATVGVGGLAAGGVTQRSGRRRVEVRAKKKKFVGFDYSEFDDKGEQVGSQHTAPVPATPSDAHFEPSFLEASGIL